MHGITVHNIIMKRVKLLDKIVVTTSSWYSNSFCNGHYSIHEYNLYNVNLQKHDVDDEL